MNSNPDSNCQIRDGDANGNGEGVEDGGLGLDLTNAIFMDELRLILRLLVCSVKLI